MHEDLVGDLSIEVKSDFKIADKKCDMKFSCNEPSLCKEDDLKNLLKGLTADEGDIVSQSALCFFLIY